MDYCTVDDVISLWRPLRPDEIGRVETLIPIVVSSLRTEADNVGKDIDILAKDNPDYKNVLKSVIVDVVALSLIHI